MQIFFDNDTDYNRYSNLDSIEYNILNHLIWSKSVHAKKLWRMLKINTSDCLTADFCDTDPTDDTPEGEKPVYVKNREKLIYRGNGNGEDKKVFLLPFLDDAFTAQITRLDIFLDKIQPVDNVKSKVDVCFEIVVHNKINNILGEGEEGNVENNPSDLDENGDVAILIKSRATAMLKHLAAELNGVFVNGVGTLQLNQQISPYSQARSYVWNNRNYFGFAVTMSTFMSGVSDNPNNGW